MSDKPYGSSDPGGSDCAAIRILGCTVGSPCSASTYSGVPFHLFSELERRKLLVGRLNAAPRHPMDLFRGLLDLRRSLAARRLRRNAYWRYLPAHLDLLSARVQHRARRLSPHDAVIQFGVAGMPEPGTTLVGHVEISVEAAASLPHFSASYGFDRGRGRHLPRAMEGERRFLDRCDLIWTNTQWTAKSFRDHETLHEKLWIHPPASNCPDPGPMEHPFTALKILFIGKDWERKGGPLLLRAFEAIRHRRPDAELTVVGCRPVIDTPGVSVLGFLDKQSPVDRARLLETFQSATLFCMPSHWESVGLVYMEAALHALPLVMLSGQGREEIFPQKMAIQLRQPDAAELADAILGLAGNPALARAMGLAGRETVLGHYTWPVVADRLLARIGELRRTAARSPVGTHPVRLGAR